MSSSGLRFGLLGPAVVYDADGNIGYAHLTLGEPARALEHFDRAQSVSDGVDWQSGSQTRLGLVRALRGLDRTERAARECTLLLERAEQRADRFTAGLARHQRGLLLRSAGRADEAYEPVGTGPRRPGRHRQPGDRRAEGATGIHSQCIGLQAGGEANLSW